MTAVDHAARIAVEFGRHAPVIKPVWDGALVCACGEWETTDVLAPLWVQEGEYRTHVAEALVANGIGVLPEAEVTEEWGTPAPDNPGATDGWIVCSPDEGRTDQMIRRENGEPEIPWLRRTRTRYAEHVTEWEAVE